MTDGLATALWGVLCATPTGPSKRLSISHRITSSCADVNNVNQHINTVNLYLLTLTAGDLTGRPFVLWF